MHVIVGCGLGGGSLVNAGVSLQPESAVFADAAWPEPISRDGLLDEGFARAEAWLRPNAHPARQRDDEIPLAREGRQGAAGARCMASRVAVSFADTVNAAGIEQKACTFCGDCCGGLQRRRQEHGGADLSAGCGAARRRDLHQRQGPPRGERALDGRWRVWARAVGCGKARQRGADRDHGGHRGAGGRHARLDRDPVALARAGTCASPTGWASASPPTATSSPSATAPRCRSMRSASAIRPRCQGSRSAPPFPARSRSVDEQRSRQSRADHAGRRAAVGAGAGAAGAVHPQRPPARRAAEPRHRRLQGAVREPADVLCRVARQRLGPVRAR